MWTFLIPRPLTSPFNSVTPTCTCTSRLHRQTDRQTDAFGKKLGGRNFLFIFTHTHTRLTALCPGLSGSAGTRKVKLIWILPKQVPVSGSGISWAICKGWTPMLLSNIMNYCFDAVGWGGGAGRASGLYKTEWC